MKALWLSGGRLRLREDVETAATAVREARVRVLTAGICGTDLALVDGLYPFEGVPGHEFVGIVEDGPYALMGKRVVGEINAGCGCCPECLAGLAKHCRARTALGIRGRNGAFAEYLQLPADNLHPIPDSVSTDAAVFTEPLAAALDIVERLAPATGARVLVVGGRQAGSARLPGTRRQRRTCRRRRAKPGKTGTARRRGREHLAGRGHRAPFVFHGRGVHGQPVGTTHRPSCPETPGHFGAEEYLCTGTDHRYGAAGSGRAAAGRLALRALRRGIGHARRATAGRSIADRCTIPPGQWRRGLRIQPPTGCAESPAGN